MAKHTDALPPDPKATALATAEAEAFDLRIEVEALIAALPEAERHDAMARAHRTGLGAKLAYERQLRFEETARLTRLCQELQSKVATLEKEKEALLNSTSWRISAPIRVLKRLLGKRGS